MKELEKTKRISISGVLFLLVIVIAILTYKKPIYIFENNAKPTLEKLITSNYILSLDSLNTMDPTKYTLIDIRSNFEFAQGHFENATNIATNQLLEDQSIAFIHTLKNTNKTVVLYGANVDEANSAWMLLYQLGYNNTKLLSVTISFENNKFHATNYTIEQPDVNYKQVMVLAMAKPNPSTVEAPKKIIEKAAPKKVVPVQKKKKMAPEGGC